MCGFAQVFVCHATLCLLLPMLDVEQPEYRLGKFRNMPSCSESRDSSMISGLDVEPELVS